MKNLKLSLAAIGTLSLLASAPSHAQVLATWNFEKDAIATNDTPAADIGTGTADSIGMTNSLNSTTSTTTDDVLAGVTSGKNTDTGANGVADGTQEWRVRGQTPGNGWSSQAALGTQGAQFFVPTTSATAGSSAINISFDWYSTTQGEANLELAYTTNGGTSWTDVPVTLSGSDAGLQVLTNSTSANTVTGSYLSDNLLTGGSKAGQDWFTGLTATITNPAALNDAGFGIEMVNASTGADDLNTQGTALNNTSGNWRFDNITVGAVPEPSSWVLALLAAGGFAMLVRKNTKRA